MLLYIQKSRREKVEGRRRGEESRKEGERVMAVQGEDKTFTDFREIFWPPPNLAEMHLEWSAATWLASCIYHPPLLLVASCSWVSNVLVALMLELPYLPQQ